MLTHRVVIPTPVAKTDTHDTPAMRELKKQMADLRDKMERQRVHYEEQLAKMRAARKGSPSDLQAAEQRAAQHRARADALELRLAEARAENGRLVERIHVGIERREEMVAVLYALLTCEDDDNLTDEQHDARMDQVLRHARTLVAAERLAVRAAPPRVES